MDTQTVKTGAIAIAAVYVICPHCGCEGAVENKGNGLILQTYEEWMALPFHVRCAECGERFRLPASPFHVKIF